MLAVASGLTGDRVTLTDVAEHAGVSAAAASLALRGLAGVAESTRQRVRAAAVDLGYRGRGSATEQLTIGLLMKARPHEVGAANAFYGPVMAGITAAAAALAVDVRLDSLPVDEHYDPIEVPRLLEAPGIHGVLVLGAYLSAESARMLGKRPVVLVDGCAEDRRHFATVITDNLDGAHQATQRSDRPRPPTDCDGRFGTQRLPVDPRPTSRLPASDGRSGPADEVRRRTPR